MGLTKTGLLLAICLVATVTFQRQTEPRNNKLVFPSQIENVIDSISRMEYLLKRFPRTYMVNYFIDHNGYLYLSNQRIALVEGAINNPKVRKDMVFEDFNDREIDEFFHLIAYLWRNGIRASHKEPSLDKFVFSYGGERPKSKYDSRSLMIVSQSQDTLNTNFMQFFKVMNKRGNLILFAPR